MVDRMGPPMPHVPPACTLTTCGPHTSTTLSLLLPGERAKSSVAIMKGVPVRSTLAKPPAEGPTHAAAVAYGEPTPVTVNRLQLCVTVVGSLTTETEPILSNRSMPACDVVVLRYRRTYCEAAWAGGEESERES